MLGVFKYFDFFADLANLIPGVAAPRFDLALPLGISFFTFHHVMYLTDLRAGRAPRYDLVRYALYIAFFPQVLAGPLVRWRRSCTSSTSARTGAGTRRSASPAASCSW